MPKAEFPAKKAVDEGLQDREEEKVRRRPDRGKAYLRALREVIRRKAAALAPDLDLDLNI